VSPLFTSFALYSQKRKAHQIAKWVYFIVLLLVVGALLLEAQYRAHHDGLMRRIFIKTFPFAIPEVAYLCAIGYYFH